MIGYYCRVSTEDQRIDRQLEATSEYPETQLKVAPADIDVYRDKSTGTDSARGGYRSLMDDAFLPADTERLRAGFHVLEQLVEEGWQVIYFTAKEEVGVDIVEEFGLPCSELELLP